MDVPYIESIKDSVDAPHFAKLLFQLQEASTVINRVPITTQIVTENSQTRELYTEKKIELCALKIVVRALENCPKTAVASCVSAARAHEFFKLSNDSAVITTTSSVSETDVATGLDALMEDYVEPAGLLLGGKKISSVCDLQQDLLDCLTQTGEEQRLATHTLDKVLASLAKCSDVQFSEKINLLDYTSSRSNT